MLDAAKVFPVHRRGGIIEEMEPVALGRGQLDRLRGHNLEFRHENEHTARRLDLGARHRHLGRRVQIEHIIDVGAAARFHGFAHRHQAVLVRADEIFHRGGQVDAGRRLRAALNRETFDVLRRFLKRHGDVIIPVLGGGVVEAMPLGAVERRTLDAVGQFLAVDLYIGVRIRLGIRLARRIRTPDRHVDVDLRLDRRRRRRQRGQKEQERQQRR